MVHKKFKNEVHVVKRIIVAGNEEDISSIKKNSLDLGKVYRAMFGKKNFQKKREEDQYIVKSIELDVITLGFTNVREEEDE